MMCLYFALPTVYGVIFNYNDDEEHERKNPLK